MKKLEISILLAILFFISNGVNAATITWNSTSTSSTSGSIFSLDVVGTGFLSNVDGGGVNLAFDATVLNVLSVSIDQVVWDFGASGISTGTIDNVGGTVNGIMVNALSAVTGNFNVATIQFQLVGLPGSSTGITLSEYALNPWASGGSTINPTYVNGTVSAVPLPAAVWLFGSGIIGLTALARRKHKA